MGDFETSAPSSPAFDASASPWRSPLRVRTFDLFVVLVERRLRLFAKRSLLGLVWPTASPFVLLALYTFVFHKVFAVPIPRYPEFLLAGLLPWSLVSQGIPVAVTSISSEPELVRRSWFRHEVLPLSAVAALFINFLGGLTAFIVYLGIRGELAVGLLPVLVVPIVSLVLLVSGLGVAVSLVDVYNRDLRWMIGNLLMIWFFLVPIVYSHEMTPGPARILRSIDPMNMIVGQFRDILYWGHVSQPAHMAVTLVFCALLCFGSVTVFRSLTKDLAKDV